MKLPNNSLCKGPISIRFEAPSHLIRFNDPDLLRELLSTMEGRIELAAMMSETLREDMEVLSPFWPNAIHLAQGEFFSGVETTNVAHNMQIEMSIISSNAISSTFSARYQACRDDLLRGEVDVLREVMDREEWDSEETRKLWRFDAEDLARCVSELLDGPEDFGFIVMHGELHEELFPSSSMDTHPVVKRHLIPLVPFLLGSQTKRDIFIVRGRLDDPSLHIRQNITVIPADDPMRLRLGWINFEEIGFDISSIECAHRIRLILPEDRLLPRLAKWLFTQRLPIKKWMNDKWMALKEKFGEPADYSEELQ